MAQCYRFEMAAIFDLANGVISILLLYYRWLQFSDKIGCICSNNALSAIAISNNRRNNLQSGAINFLITAGLVILSECPMINIVLPAHTKSIIQSSAIVMLGRATGQEQTTLIQLFADFVLKFFHIILLEFSCEIKVYGSVLFKSRQQ